MQLSLSNYFVLFCYLCSIFNGKRQRSIRTERVKLRHQDIRFTVAYQRGKINQSDYLSRHSKPLQKLSQSEQAEANNLLYMLHTTPALDCIGYARIAQCTKEDRTLARIRELINQGLTWIPKTETIEVQRFKSIPPQLTVTGNGMILKDEGIVLPGKLQEMAIQIAHRGAHPGQSGLERRLRYHFFFHDMSKKVKEFVGHATAVRLKSQSSHIRSQKNVGTP